MFATILRNKIAQENSNIGAKLQLARKLTFKCKQNPPISHWPLPASSCAIEKTPQPSSCLYKAPFASLWLLSGRILRCIKLRPPAVLWSLSLRPRGSLLRLLRLLRHHRQSSMFIFQIARFGICSQVGQWQTTTSSLACQLSHVSIARSNSPSLTQRAALTR